MEEQIERHVVLMCIKIGIVFEYVVLFVESEGSLGKEQILGQFYIFGGDFK